MIYLERFAQSELREIAKPWMCAKNPAHLSDYTPLRSNRELRPSSHYD